MKKASQGLCLLKPWQSCSLIIHRSLKQIYNACSIDYKILYIVTSASLFTLVYLYQTRLREWRETKQQQ